MMTICNIKWINQIKLTYGIQIESLLIKEKYGKENIPETYMVKRKWSYYG